MHKYEAAPTDFGPVTIHEFDGTGEFADTYGLGQRHGSTFVRRAYDGDFLGGEDFDTACRRAREGNPEILADAEALIEKIDANVDTLRPSWAPSVVGAYPIVPEALAGFPANMRRRVAVEADTAPVRIYVDLVSSAGITAETLRRRGTAILALASKLSDSRSVELFGVMPWSRGYQQARQSHGADLILLRLGVSPLNLTLVVNALASQGLTRGLGMSWAYARAEGFAGQWAFDGSCGPDYTAALRESLGLSPQDLMLSGSYLETAQHKDPVAWVTKELEKFQTVEAD